MKRRKSIGYKCIRLQPVSLFLPTLEYYIPCEQQIHKLRANSPCLLEPLGITQSSGAYPEPHLSLPGVRKRRRKEWGSCPPRVPVAGRVCHRGEMGGDTPKMGFLIRLAFGQSLIWALCQASFSTLDCRMNAFLGAVVAGRREAA